MSYKTIMPKDSWSRIARFSTYAEGTAYNIISNYGNDMSQRDDIAC